MIRRSVALQFSAFRPSLTGKKKPSVPRRGRGFLYDETEPHLNIAADETGRDGRTDTILTLAPPKTYMWGFTRPREGDLEALLRIYNSARDPREARKSTHTARWLWGPQQKLKRENWRESGENPKVIVRALAPDEPGQKYAFDVGTTPLCSTAGYSPRDQPSSGLVPHVASLLSMLPKVGGRHPGHLPATTSNPARALHTSIASCEPRERGRRKGPRTGLHNSSHQSALVSGNYTPPPRGPPDQPPPDPLNPNPNPRSTQTDPITQADLNEKEKQRRTTKERHDRLVREFMEHTHQQPHTYPDSAVDGSLGYREGVPANPSPATYAYPRSMQTDPVTEGHVIEREKQRRTTKERHIRLLAGLTDYVRDSSTKPDDKGRVPSDLAPGRHSTQLTTGGAQSAKPRSTDNLPSHHL